MLDLNNYYIKRRLLLTPNQRLARKLIAEACDIKFQQNSYIVLHEFNIKSLGDYINDLYNLSIENGYLDHGRYTINAWQREIIFKYLIKEYNRTAEANNESILPESIYRKIIQAWSIATNWQLDWQTWKNYHQIEAKIFCHIANAYINHLDQHELIDPDCRIDALLSLSQTQLNNINNCSVIELYGFDDYSPKLLQFFERLKDFDVTVNILDENKSIPERVELFAAANNEHEYYGLAQWAKQQIADNCKNVGVVVPNLATHRNKLIKIFEEVIPNRQSWNISGGDPISLMAVVKVALTLLHLVIYESISLHNLRYVLKSNYYYKSSDDDLSRTNSAIDHLLSDLEYGGYTEVTLQHLLQKLNLISSHFIHIFVPNVKKIKSEDLFTSHQKMLLPSQWVSLFSEILISMGWPAGQNIEESNTGININSTEFQAITQFQMSLQQIKQLDPIWGSKPANIVFNELKNLLEHTPFQIQTDQNQIDILGMLEGAGIKYSKLWLFNMTSDVWPGSADPNPFIPVEIQRQHQLPHATAEREYAYAEKLTTRYFSSSDHLIISYSKHEKDKENTLSLLLSDLVVQDKKMKDLWIPSVEHTTFETCKLLSLVDERGPPQEKIHIKGGVKALNLQSLCPFRAFAETRLNATGRFKLTIGPAAWLRGQIIHKVLENIFKNFVNKQQLIEFCESSTYNEQLHQFITTAIKDFQLRYNNIFTHGIVLIEIELIYDLIGKWLGVEIARNNFTVWALEQEYLLKLEDLSFKVRVDRIDQVDATSETKYIIIDYKTSKQNINNLFAEELSNVQLPLYTLIEQIPQVDAILFAEILDDGYGFNGLTDENIRITGSVTVNEWQELQQGWKKDINKIATDFKNGHAEVKPRDASICHNCHLPTFCRKDEVW